MQNKSVKLNSGVTAPKGFLAAGIHIGLKKRKKDLALIYSGTPATAAGVFTLNKVKAAPVILCKEHLSKGKNFHAIIVNSGNANACTGEQGLKNAFATANQTAKVLNIKPEQVFVSSTGVIGEQLPVEKILNGINNIKENLSSEDNQSAAEAIMTTDTFIKSTSVKYFDDGVEITIGGIAKGSGMIHPNMATMLAFITTDAKIEQPTFQNAMKSVVDKTFNRIVVDGDTSTNDMVLGLANGLSQGKLITDNSESFNLFYNHLLEVLKELSVDIVKDGEGATKLIEINVEGALNNEEAYQAAKTIALSPLVKTAIHGEDANWGRIIAAVGYSGIEFNPEKFEIIINGVQILKENFSVCLPAEKANETLKPDEINLLIKLNNGYGNATCWTCDFSEKYVEINGSYRS
ncbi:MAG: ornithine acetyltransferase [Ignavibacteriales bacterium CG_4_9_14_3_um_filter_34_10]|nr:MAG: ornithine acetyltransferase [Ignavibacteriales bacterium CG_4_9_14_3_um_filter_34_10]